MSRSNGDLIDQVRALIDEAHLTPGARVDAKLHLVARSLGIFTSNAAELRVRLDDEQRIGTWIKLGPGSEAAFDQHMDEIDRLLHNFLAAAFTVSEHTIAVRKDLQDEAFTRDYNTQSPFEEPVCQLIKVLRRDAQHAHLPVVQQDLELTMGPPSTAKCRLVIPRSYLEGLELNGQTKQHLRELDSDPALEDLVDTHTLHVERFTAWFVGAVVRLRADDLTETYELRRRAGELSEPLRRAFDAP